MVQHLGSHIQWRTQNSLDLLVLRTQQLSESEIRYLDGAVVLEYIGQFEVPVHDFTFDQRLKGMQNLHEVLKRLLLWQFLLSFEVGQQVALVTILQYEVDVVGCLLDVDEPDDVVIAATLKDLYLVLEQFGKLA
jgi:hypothetical protein